MQKSAIFAETDFTNVATNLPYQHLLPAQYEMWVLDGCTIMLNIRSVSMIVFGQGSTLVYINCNLSPLVVEIVKKVYRFIHLIYF